MWTVAIAKRSWVCVVATILVMITVVQGAPFLGPDLATCAPTHWTILNVPVTCCLPGIVNGKSVKPLTDYEFPADLPMRVRQPLHKLDEFRMTQLERGIALMKALPHDDVRSWYQQNEIHCSYTTAVYQMIGGPKEGQAQARVMVHTNWLFFPYHAWYVYFIERIIADLVEDETFAMPYWAWDVSESARIPPAFMNESSSLWDPHRLQRYGNGSTVELTPYFDFSNHDNEVVDFEARMKSNNYQMRHSFAEFSTPAPFYGDRYAAGDDATTNSGTMEGGAHLAIHIWLVDKQFRNGEDMGQSHTSALDPLFIMHHAQVDRLWRLRQNRGAKRGAKDLDDPDYLDAQFFLYDENSDFVRVNVSGAVHSDGENSMRYVYEEVEKEWLETDTLETSIRARGDVKYPPNNVWRQAWRSVAQTFPTSLLRSFMWKPMENRNVDIVCAGASSTALVPLPSAAELRRSPGSYDDFDKVLVVSGVVTKPFHLMASLRIFVELPEADSSTPEDCLESLGHIFLQSEAKLGGETIVDRKFQHKAGMGKKLQSLGITHLESLSVTFVSDWDSQFDGQVSVKFTDVRMEVQRL